MLCLKMNGLTLNGGRKNKTVKPDKKASIMSNPVQFLTDYLSNNRLIEWLPAFRKIFSKSLIDHCLVSIPCLFRSYTKIIEDIRKESGSGLHS